MEEILLSDEDCFTYPITTSFKVSKKRMDRILEELTERFSDKPLIFFATGTSGAICLTLIQMLYPDVKVCLLNTSGSSHRSRYEWSGRSVPRSALFQWNTVFVDDLVATGSTLVQCRQILQIEKFDIVATLFNSLSNKTVKANAHNFITYTRTF